jgi:hypothetical protein
MTAPASKDELVWQIADELGWSKATTRLHLERIREDFNGVFRDHETLTQQRNRLREIERACPDGAAAVGHAPQEVDWLPKKFSLRDPRSGVERQFEIRITPTEYSAISWAYAEAAKQAADKLQAGLRHESTIAEEKAIARAVWLMMGGPVIAEPELRQYRTNAEYLAANWARLSRRFRGTYSKLQKVRRKRWRQLLRLGRRREKYMQARPLNPILPRPADDQYVPPAPVRERFPWGKYLTITALTYEYVTGEHRDADSFATACREARKESES